MPARPLAALGTRLKGAAPPRLEALQDALLVGEGFGEFLELVRQYTPEYEAEVLHASGRSQRMAIFASRFEDRYFPLHRVFQDTYDTELSYSYMVESIHTIPLGWDDEDLHSIEDIHNGFQLLFALARCCEKAPECFHDQGLRVPALEACLAHTRRDVLGRIPPEGYDRAELHRLLDSTQFEAAAKAADWFYNDTGNGFLDMGDELNAQCYDPWDPETVATMTRLWQEAQLRHDQFHDLRTWLEQDTNQNFAQLLDFIPRRKEAHDPRQLRLTEGFAPQPDPDFG